MAPSQPPLLPAHRLAALDLLRGVAIVAVVWLHVAIYFSPVGSIFQRVAGFGAHGVQLFFLVSAYTMCHQWTERRDEPARVFRFYVRRFFRIAPMFWLAIVCYGAMVTFQGHPPTWTGIAASATFLHGLSPDTIAAVVPGGWSIADEMMFYAAFPLLAVTLRTPLACLLGGFGSFVTGALLQAAIVARVGTVTVDFDMFLYWTLLTQAPVFLVGMAMFKLLEEGRPPDWREIGLAVVWIALAFSLKARFGPSGRPSFWLIVACLAVFTALTIRLNLRFSPLQRLGQMSYSIYLVHFAVIEGVQAIFQAMGWTQTRMLCFWAVLVAVLALSWLFGKASSHTLEVWSAAMGRAVIQRHAAWRMRGRNRPSVGISAQQDPGR